MFEIHVCVPWVGVLILFCPRWTCWQLIVVIIPDVVFYVSWYHLLALWRDSCCLEGSRMRSRGPIRLNLKGIRWPLPVLWVFCRWVRLVYVDRGMGVVLPSAA